MLRLNQRNILNISAFWKHHIDTSCLFKNQQNGWLTCEIVTFPPPQILLKIYQSLIYPYITYGLAAWGQAAKTHLHKILVLQKRALRIINFSDRFDHAIPLFIYANLLPLIFLYYQTISNLMYDVHHNALLVFISIFCTHCPASNSLASCGQYNL